jgi:hypothetical protein
VHDLVDLMKMWSTKNVLVNKTISTTYNIFCSIIFNTYTAYNVFVASCQH